MSDVAAAPLITNITSGGDAVPGGYNGWFAAWSDEERLGYLDYQSCRWDGGQDVLIAMVEVDVRYRGHGVATTLACRLREEFGADANIEAGLLTEDGAGWWAAARSRFGC